MSSEEESSIELMQEQSLKGRGETCKVKRTKQRVDAGQPRNSYASIANFSSRNSLSYNNNNNNNNNSNSYLHSSTSPFNGLSPNNKQLIGDLISKSSLSDNNSGLKTSDNMIVIDDHMIQMCVNGGLGASQLSPPYLNGINNGINPSLTTGTNGNNGHRRSSDIDFHSSKITSANFMSPKSLSSTDISSLTNSSAHLLRDILQTGRKFEHSIVDIEETQRESNASGNNLKVGGLSQCSDASELDELDEEEEELGEVSRDDDEGMLEDHLNKAEVGESSPSEEDKDNGKLSPSELESQASNRPSNTNNNPNSNISSGSSSTIAEVKRARVENIVTNMLLGGNSNPNELRLNAKSGSGSESSMPVSVNGCKKRKLYQPQQSKLNGPNENENEDDVDFEDVDELALGIGEDVDETELGEEEEEAEDTVSEIDLSAKKAKLEDQHVLRRQLGDMQAQLVAMRSRYVQLFEAQQKQNANAQNHFALTPMMNSPSGMDECDPEMDDLVSDKANSPSNHQLPHHNQRDTPAILSGAGNVTSTTNSVANSGIINDPAHFIDEARRLISEQEKMTHKSDRQSCIVRSAGVTSLASQITPSVSDLEWLIETLKNEMQTSILHIIDNTFNKFLQRKSASQKINMNIDQASESNNRDRDRERDITLLSQMLDRKGSSPSRPKVIDRGNAAAATNAASIGNQMKNNNNSGMNGPSQQQQQQLTPTRASPFNLQTELAPAPKPAFPFPPPNFKSPFFLPSLAPPGAQMPLQPALIPPALAQHFNNIATSLNQVNQQREQQERLQQQQNASNNYNQSNTNNRDVIIRDNNCAGNTNSCSAAALQNMFSRSEREDAPEQTEAMSLVVAPKRKRHKVTDTRITPRTVSRLLGQESLICRDGGSISPTSMSNYHHSMTPSQPPPPLVPVSLPTSVAIPNPSLHQSDIFNGPFPFGEHPRLSLFGNDNDDGDLTRDNMKGHSVSYAVASQLAHAAAANHLQMLAASRSSPDSLHGYSSSALYNRVSSENGGDNGSETNETQTYDPLMPLTSTLTPMHLRKAKLMFFFVRYPSSAILKMYFPDIKFNKNNTAQLVKWFSNFREFFYIQMEKYARQATSEGVKNAEDLQICHDGELLRVLNLHYNRNNHIEVPENFRYVSEQTLREFFKAVLANKDSEQSWKKAIYKIIARMDDNVPEYFKSPNFLEQLE